jgi:hypothetical protein
VRRACEETGEAETETAGNDHAGDYTAGDPAETGDDPGEWDCAKDWAVKYAQFSQPDSTGQPLCAS